VPVAGCSSLVPIAAFFFISSLTSAQCIKHNIIVLTQHWAGNPCAAGKHSIFAWPLRVFVNYKNHFKFQFEFAFTRIKSGSLSTSTKRRKTYFYYLLWQTTRLAVKKGKVPLNVNNNILLPGLHIAASEGSPSPLEES